MTHSLDGFAALVNEAPDLVRAMLAARPTVEWHGDGVRRIVEVLGTVPPQASRT